MSTLTHLSIPAQQGSFAYWWQQQGRWVEIPNERRGGQSGVQQIHESGELLYAKRQVGHVYRAWLKPLGAPTILRETYAYRCFSALGINVPQLVFSGAQKVAGQWQALLVTKALTDFVELDSWYQTHPTEQQRRSMLIELARTLSVMHRGRWQHGCLYAKHIFVRTRGEDVEVALLDLEKCRKRLFAVKAQRNDLNQFRRHKGQMPEQDFAQLLKFYQQT